MSPLMGMLLAELKPAKHAVDFLHPRRRALPDPRKKWMIAGAAAAVLLLAWIVYSRVEHYLLVNAVRRVAAGIQRPGGQDCRREKVRANTADIAKWYDDDVIWLDRIYKLDKSFPPPADMVAERIERQHGRERRTDDAQRLGQGV